jgi:ribonuclease HII
MVAADPEHPPYRFGSNKGYPSPEHRRALAQAGPCPLHRASWAPIAALAQPPLFTDELLGGGVSSP